jgi:hypothetical protein
MSACEQSPGQSVLQHGEAVAERYADLVGERRMRWRLQGWLDLGLLLPLCPPAETMRLYQIYHDCHKNCEMVIDESGRRHFLNHAMHSAAMWLSVGGDRLVGKLIEHDMDMHTMKPADVLDYNHYDLAPALLLTALCELHANAEMFGGWESTSFKIKWKALNKLGKAFVSVMGGSTQVPRTEIAVSQSPYTADPAQS